MNNEYIVDYDIYEKNSNKVVGWGNISIDASKYVTSNAFADAVRKHVAKDFGISTEQVRIVGVFKL